MSLKRHITNLERLGTRFYYTNGNKAACKYIQTQLAHMGYKSQLNKFNYNKKKFANVFFQSETNNDILFVAHLDTINNDDIKSAPGANDNATGVAMLLELAKVLRANTSRKDISFLFTNLEEFEQEGAKAFIKYAQKIKYKPKYVINIDTIGNWNSPLSKDFPVNYVTNDDSIEIIELLKKHTDLPLEEAKEKWEDDHKVFWDNGIKAIELTENGVTDFMHTSFDTSENLDFESLELILKELSKFVINVEI